MRTPAQQSASRANGARSLNLLAKVTVVKKESLKGFQELVRQYMLSTAPRNAVEEICSAYYQTNPARHASPQPPAGPHGGAHCAPEPLSMRLRPRIPAPRTSAPGAPRTAASERTQKTPATPAQPPRPAGRVFLSTSRGETPPPDEPQPAVPRNAAPDAPLPRHPPEPQPPPAGPMEANIEAAPAQSRLQPPGIWPRTSRRQPSQRPLAPPPADFRQ
jgi:hypothetical protein